MQLLQLKAGRIKMVGLGWVSRTSVSWALLLAIFFTANVAHASDPTPIAGIIFVVSIPVMLLGAALAAAHRFAAMTVGLLALVPGLMGVRLVFVYWDTKAGWAGMGYLVVYAILWAAIIWRLRRDYEHGPDGLRRRAKAKDGQAQP